jgi:hypothetical protein
MVTKENAMFALRRAMTDQSRDVMPDGTRKNMGGMALKKANGLPSYGSVIAECLARHNGTFFWDIDDLKNGKDVFDNIYQYLAAETYSHSDRQRDRVQISEDYENNTRSGVNSLSKWLDEQHGIVLYRPTLHGSGNLVRAITVDPGYVVDPRENISAQQAQLSRDIKAIEGQVKATTRRCVRSLGVEEAQTKLSAVVQSAVFEPIAAPINNRISAESDDIYLG